MAVVGMKTNVGTRYQAFSNEEPKLTTAFEIKPDNVIDISVDASALKEALAHSSQRKSSPMSAEQEAQTYLLMLYRKMQESPAVQSNHDIINIGPIDNRTLSFSVTLDVEPANRDNVMGVVAEAWQRAHTPEEKQQEWREWADGAGKKQRGKKKPVGSSKDNVGAGR